MKKFLLLLLGFSLSLAPLENEVSAYSDLPPDALYLEAIEWLSETGAVSGYGDGTFKPNQKITRAEFLKVLIALTENEPPQHSSSPCFTDVSIEAWYAPYVCRAKDLGLVNGYSNGHFEPGKNINTVEASKIIVEALDVDLLSTISGAEWYSPYVETLGSQGVYPSAIQFLNEELTRGEVAEMLWRIEEGKKSEPSSPWEALSTCMILEQDLPTNVDWDRVKETWLSWTNETRAQQGLTAYVENIQLNRTAILWSELGEDRGYMDHKRPGTTAYYDYYAIQNWFSDLGLEFTNKGGYTFTENIGRGPYSCSDDECTDELLRAIRYTYDYYLSEAGSSYRPHWNSIVNNSFKEIGFGISVDSSSYYLTVHYATEISSNPAPICD